MRRLLLLSLFCLGITPFSSQLYGQDVLEGVAGVVGSHGQRDLVTPSEVRELVEPQEKAARGTLKGQELVEKIKELRSAAINEIVDRLLILQDFKARGDSL